MSWPQEMGWLGVGLCTSVAAVPFISDLKIKDKSRKVWQGSKEIPTWASLSFSCACVSPIKMDPVWDKLRAFLKEEKENNGVRVCVSQVHMDETRKIPCLW